MLSAFLLKARSVAPAVCFPSSAGSKKSCEDTNVPIIPVHLDQLWGSIFSFEDGRFFWKWPKQLPYPVTVSFGSPLPSSATALHVRNTIAELAAQQSIIAPSADLLHQGLLKPPNDVGSPSVWPIPPVPS